MIFSQFLFLLVLAFLQFLCPDVVFFCLPALFVFASRSVNSSASASASRLHRLSRQHCRARHLCSLSTASWSFDLLSCSRVLKRNSRHVDCVTVLDLWVPPAAGCTSLLFCATFTASSIQTSWVTYRFRCLQYFVFNGFIATVRRRTLISRSDYTTVGQTVGQTVCATGAQYEHYVRQMDRQFVQQSAVAFTPCNRCTDSWTNCRQGC